MFFRLQAEVTGTEIARDEYLQRLKDRMWNRRIKVVTGIRRCGKSYLLFNIFRRHLLSEGVPEGNIIGIALDDFYCSHLRDARALLDEIMSRASDPDGRYYVLIDEIQMVPGFGEVMNTLVRHDRLDVYVTGSNSKGLSSDIRTEYRGRGDEVRVRPLSFAEFSSAYEGGDAWLEYCTYGGMPETVSMRTAEQKQQYLGDLMRNIYMADMQERHDIRMPDELSIVTDVLCSSVGSLTNPLKLSNTLRTEYRSGIADDTVNRYLGILEDSYLFEKARRFDVKARKELGSPVKYYAEDVGLRNARLGFADLDMPHIMENIVYSELRRRGFQVSVGVVEVRVPEDGASRSVRLEVDFVAVLGDRRYYVQSAYAVPDGAKREQEKRPFKAIRDGYRKVLVVGHDLPPHLDSDGVLNVGIRQFLLDPGSLDRRADDARPTPPHPPVGQARTRLRHVYVPPGHPH